MQPEQRAIGSEASRVIPKIAILYPAGKNFDGSSRTSILSHFTKCQERPCLRINDNWRFLRKWEVLEAEEIYRRVLKGEEKVFGSEHTYTLQTVHELGNAFEYQDKHVQAKETYQRATKGWEQTLGPSHEDTLESMKCLEDVLGCLENYEREGEQMRALFD